ncbi:MAG: helix-turn-helix domain-containing protein [Planctomycetota bacterium]
MKLTLSPRDLAQAVGVSESSLKRWADAGKVRVSRTVGGHRRIEIAEAVRFVREAKLRVVRPDLLGLPDAPSGLEATGPTEAIEAFTDLLLRGRADQARALAAELYLGGAALTEIFDGPVRHAMHHIGTIWRHSPEGICVEHRATDAAIGVVYQLRSMLPQAGDQTGDHPDPADAPPVALGGCPSGDPYILPSLMCSAVAAEAGFRAVNLGPETPLETLRVAVASHHARLVWLSGSVPEAWPPAPEFRAFAAELAQQGVRLIVGGQGVPHADGALGPHAHRLDNMVDLGALAREVLAEPPAARQAG